MAIPPDTPGAPDFSITNVPPEKPTPPPAQAPTQQKATPPAQALWMRMWDLVISGGKGAEPNSTNTASLAQFHFTFEVEMSCAEHMFPRAVVTVFNPPKELVNNNLEQWSDISISGGYQKARYGELFHGKITYFKIGKHGPLETFLEIHAIDGDEVFVLAVVNQALNNGYKGGDVISAVLTTMDPFGITAGQISDVVKNIPAAPRGRTLFGSPPDILRDVAQSTNSRIFIDQGKLNVLAPGEQLNGDDIPINLQNGLVNVPTQELGQGIRLQCLLHFQVRPGRVIKINNKDVTQIVAGQAYGIDQSTMQSIPVTQDIAGSDGRYGVFSVKHHGDNRGTPWYTDIVTNPIAPVAPSL